MDHYSRLTDVMMEEFERLSIGLQRAGGRFNVPKKKLFALVCRRALMLPPCGAKPTADAVSRAAHLCDAFPDRRSFGRVF